MLPHNIYQNYLVLKYFRTMNSDHILENHILVSFTVIMSKISISEFTYRNKYSSSHILSETHVIKIIKKRMFFK